MDYKRRPALVLAAVPFGDSHDYLLCACSLTAEPGEHHLIPFAEGDLKADSAFRGSGFIRPTILFTIDGRQVNRSLGQLNEAKLYEVMRLVRELLG